jgi:hypothetical protein
MYLAALHVSSVPKVHIGQRFHADTAFSTSLDNQSLTIIGIPDNKY